MNSVNINSFFNPSGKLLTNLISDTGNGNIRNIIDYINQTISEGNYRNSKLNNNQLRKFYDTFLKVFNNKVEEKEKKIQLLMLKANAEYSAKRLHTNRFKEFLSNRIDVVVSKNGKEFNDNLKALKLHLEALVAYYPKN